MNERNRNLHPEIDIPATTHALIGAVPVPAPESEPEKPLDIPTIVNAFQTDAYPIQDDGTFRIAVGKEAALTISPAQETLVYEHITPDHSVYLKLTAAGEVVFTLTPKPPVAASGEKALLPEPVEAGKPEEPPEQTPIPADNSPEKEKKERVTITGRVGREPSFKNIKTGVIAKFPIAEHSDTDGSTKTTWHTIVSFGKTAEALRGTVAKGQMVTIAGYPHERTITNPKTGMERIVTEIYLAGGIKHHK